MMSFRRKTDPRGWLAYREAEDRSEALSLVVTVADRRIKVTADGGYLLIEDVGAP